MIFSWSLTKLIETITCLPKYTLFKHNDPRAHTESYIYIYIYIYVYIYIYIYIYIYKVCSKLCED